MQKIEKIIIPVAGIGSRMLPITQFTPKAMLCVANKPLIQYALEETIIAGITSIIFIVGYKKKLIKKYFNHYNTYIETKNSQFKINNTTTHIKNIKIHYIIQNKLLGLGHAIWCAKNIINNEPFAVLLPDDLIKSKYSLLKQMIKNFKKLNCSIIAFTKVKKKYINEYGIIYPSSQKKLTKILNIIEKPSYKATKSNSSIIGRYIFTPQIFKYIQKRIKKNENEINITDAITQLIKREPVYGYHYNGKRFDCGNKNGYKTANIEYSIYTSKLNL